MVRRNYSKYKSVKCEYNGHKFDSVKEMYRYRKLKDLEDSEEISHLVLQPRFLLADGFTHKGKKYRKIEYIADFQYIDNIGNEIVEDTKGFKTDVYNIKKKLFLLKYGEKYDFREL